MSIRNMALRVMRWVEDLYCASFGPGQNPFTYLGAMTIYFFWIALVTGIYLFLFFEMNVRGAYHSIELITHEQWYLGGVMRSLHRYASDAAVIAILLHMTREFLRNRYRGPRWYSWFTGVPVLWTVTLLGITGYWLVWDELAQYIAVATAELLDVLPVFTDPIARNFITDAALSDRFFTLMAFLHLLGIPIILILAVWFHVLRIVNPKINPPRVLMAGTFVALLALSFVKPAVSHDIADLGKMPAMLDIDWYYLAVYPLMDVTSPTFVWVALMVGTIFVAALPWLPKEREKPVAEVNLDHCTGCTFCALDCPYGAISMVDRSDGRRFKQEAVVDPSMCVSCGICVGSCPQSTPFRKIEQLVTGIDLPQFALHRLHDDTVRAVEANREEDQPRILVYGCDYGVEVEKLQIPGVTAVSLPCTGMLPPAMIDFAMREERADGVVVTGCCKNNCQYRLGNNVMEERIRGEREPRLRARVDRSRLRVHWAAATEAKPLKAEIADFRAELKQSLREGAVLSSDEASKGQAGAGG